MNLPEPRHICIFSRSMRSFCYVLVLIACVYPKYRFCDGQSGCTSDIVPINSIHDGLPFHISLSIDDSQFWIHSVQTILWKWRQFVRINIRILIRGDMERDVRTRMTSFIRMGAYFNIHHQSVKHANRRRPLLNGVYQGAERRNRSMFFFFKTQNNNNFTHSIGSQQQFHAVRAVELLLGSDWVRETVFGIQNCCYLACWIPTGSSDLWICS